MTRIALMALVLSATVSTPITAQAGNGLVDGIKSDIYWNLRSLSRDIVKDTMPTLKQLKGMKPRKSSKKRAVKPRTQGKD